MTNTGRVIAVVDQLAPALDEFRCRQSDDIVKRDLELVHLPCGTHVCDVEPDDELGVLARTAVDHLARCQRIRGDRR